MAELKAKPFAGAACKVGMLKRPKISAINVAMKILRIRSALIELKPVGRSSVQVKSMIENDAKDNIQSSLERVRQIRPRPSR
jgi:hypothetical protein